MSNFGVKLAELLERRGMRASELSRVTGINDGLISKWINGQQKFVSNDDLANLTTGISPITKERAELIRAHLLDEIAGDGRELIEIRIKGQSGTAVKEDSAPYTVALPLKLQRAFEILAREVVSDSDVRAVVLGLANMLEPEANSGRRLAEEYAEDSLKKHEGRDAQHRKPTAKPQS